MDIIFRVLWQVEVDDMIHVFYVNAPGHDIGCHQNPYFTGLEILQSVRSFLLGHITG